MAKTKKKFHKKSESPKPAKVMDKTNPFEIKKNRQHHNVLGHKLRNSSGKPNSSRSKYMEKQHVMLKNQNLLTKKSNTFVDHRFGEKDDNFGDSYLASRIVQAKKKAKKNIYNLNTEEDMLTHLGQSVDNLETMKNFTRESDEEDDMNLDADYVNDAHFGGGVFTKAADSAPLMSHKETIDKLIADSKKKKEELKVEKELNLDLTEKLDEQWKNVFPLMSGLRKKPETESKECNTYDLMVNELRSEPRALPSKLSISQAEIEEAAKKKYMELEKERLIRMQGIPPTKNRLEKDDISADSIYDGLDLGMDTPEECSGEMDEAKESDVSDSKEDNDESIEEVRDNQRKIRSIKVVSNITSYSKAVEQFTNFLSSMSNSNVSISLDEMAKGKASQDDLGILFDIVLNYVDRSCEKNCFQPAFLDDATPLLHTLVQYYDTEIANVFKKRLEVLSKDNQISTIPKPSTLILFKLAAILFSTSDFRHPVVTPVLTLMNNVLNSKYEVTLQQILTRLFICGLFYESVDFSKRLCIEPIHFLIDVLYFATKEQFSMPKDISYATHAMDKDKKILLLETPVLTEPSKINLSLFQLSEDVLLQEGTCLATSILHCTIQMLHAFAKLYSSLPVFRNLLGHIPDICKHLPLNNYPDSLQKSIESLVVVIDDATPLNYLCFVRKKPKPLKMFEPRFEKRITDTKNLKGLTAEKRLSQKIKREERGLIRELRKNTQFLSSQQLLEKRKADEERKEKVKRIYQDLAQQQCDTKVFRKKNKN